MLHLGFGKEYAIQELAPAVVASAMHVNSGTGLTAGAGIRYRC